MKMFMENVSQDMCTWRYIPGMLWDVYVTGQRSAFWHVLCEEWSGAEHVISSTTGLETSAKKGQMCQCLGGINELHVILV